MSAAASDQTVSAAPPIVRILEVRAAGAGADHPTLRAMLVAEIRTATFAITLHDLALHTSGNDARVRTPDPQSRSGEPLFNVAGQLLSKLVTFGSAVDADAFQRAALAAIRAYAPDILETPVTNAINAWPTALAEVTDPPAASVGARE